MDIGKADCKAIDFTLSLSPSEYQLGYYVGLTLYEDSSFDTLLDSLSFEVTDYFSSSYLTLTSQFEFTKKFTKSYPNAVLYVGIMDEDHEFLQLTNGNLDKSYFFSPIKCVNVAAIAGGVGGGVAVLIIIAVTVIVIRKKKQQKQKSGDNLENPTLASQPSVPFSPQFGVQDMPSPDFKETKMVFSPAPTVTQPPVYGSPQQFSAQSQQPIIYHNN